MSSSYLLTKEAVGDIEDLLSYVAKDSRHAAETLHAQFAETFRRVARNPHLGHYREDLTPKPVRFWLLHSFLVVYRPDRRPVEIIRILHGFRDVRSLLS